MSTELAKSTYSSTEFKLRGIWKDIALCRSHFGIMFQLAFLQVKKRYRRTRLGPVWIVLTNLSFGFFVGGLYANIMGKPFFDFFLYLYVGYTLWVFLADIYVNSFSLFSKEAMMMNQRSYPMSAYVMKFIMEKMLTFAHNLPVIFVVLLLHGFSFLNFLIFLGALTTIMIASFFYAMAAGIIGARYGDAHRIAASSVRIAFFLTPVIWSVDSVSDNFKLAFVHYNPFYHVLDSVRGPLLGQTVQPISLVVIFSGTVIFALVAGYLFKKYKHALIYWLG